jgi:hypothetical protein
MSKLLPNRLLNGDGFALIGAGSNNYSAFWSKCCPLPTPGWMDLSHHMGYRFTRIVASSQPQSHPLLLVERTQWQVNHGACHRDANRPTQVRPVTEDDTGLSVLYEPPIPKTTAQEQVGECVSFSYSTRSRGSKSCTASSRSMAPVPTPTIPGARKAKGICKALEKEDTEVS